MEPEFLLLFHENVYRLEGEGTCERRFVEIDSFLLGPREQDNAVGVRLLLDQAKFYDGSFDQQREENVLNRTHANSAFLLICLLRGQGP